MWSEVALSSIGDAVLVTNDKGMVAFMNPVAQTITGWTAEASGKPLPDVFRIVNEQTRLAVENLFTKLIREGAVAGMANHSINEAFKVKPEEPVGQLIHDRGNKQRRVDFP